MVDIKMNRQSARNNLLRAVNSTISILKNKTVSKDVDSTMYLKSIEGYRMGIRSSVRALWNGTWGYFEFVDAMMLAIERGYTQAWYEGAKMYGINPEDMTQAEHDRLTEEVMKETSYINGFAQAIMDNNKFMGGKLEPLFYRAEMWVNGYTRVLNIAKTLAAKDQRQIWVLNPAEHCSSCRKLDGKVKRASYWLAHITPKSWALQCRGNCKCTLEPTDKPISRGPLPMGL